MYVNKFNETVDTTRNLHFHICKKNLREEIYIALTTISVI